MISCIAILTAALLAACNLGSNSTPTGNPVERHQQELSEAGIAARVSPFPDTLDEPIHVQQVSDSATIRVWQVVRTGEDIQVYYEYNKLGEPATLRILDIHEDAEHFLIYDDAGILQSGYSAVLAGQDDIFFTYVQEEALLTIETGIEAPSPIVLTLVADPGRESVTFADLSEMADAARLLHLVETSRVSAESLSPEEQLTLAKAEEIKSWAPYLPDGEVSDEELGGLRDIRNQPAVVGSDTLDDAPVSSTIIHWICRIAKVAKFFCEYIGPNKVCEAIIAIDAICTAAGIR